MKARELREGVLNEKSPRYLSRGGMDRGGGGGRRGEALIETAGVPESHEGVRNCSGRGITDR